MPNNYRKAKVKIGLDLHNLSTSVDSVVRTGIQQVVFNLLEAQYYLGEKMENRNIELVPLPLIPKPRKEYTRFTNLMDTNVNSSQLILEATSKELGIPLTELWNDPEMENGEPWSEAKFFSKVVSLDWLVITPLSEFRYVAEEAKRRNPKLRIAVLVYDMVPLIQPDLVADGMSQWYSEAYVSGIRHFADVLFAISRHTALDCMKELESILGVHVPIIATPLPPEIPSIVEENSSLLESYDIVKQNYFICLGTIEPRKNLSLAVRGFLRFRELFPELSKKYKLVLVGAAGWSQEDEMLYKEIEDTKENFVFPGYLPRAEVEQLIRHANALIMPSRYEGFGMPLSLASVLGTKVITCHNSSLTEAAGFDATYVPLDSPDTMALALVKHASTQYSSKEKGISLHESNKVIRKEWQKILERWVDTFVSFKQSSNPGQYNLHQVPKRLKICVDVHNLSIETQQLRKTGIQEVAFQLLKSLSLLRVELADVVEIIALPVLLSSEKYFVDFEATCTCSPKVLQQVEQEICQELGISGKELWGFDLASMNYRINPMNFRRLVSNADWFFVTSQYDIRRCYKALKESTPNVKISYLVYDLIPTLFPELVAKGQEAWFTYQYLRGLRNYASLAVTISTASALDLLNHTENEQLPFPVFSRLLPLNQHNSKAELILPDSDLHSNSLREHKLKAGKYFLLIGSTDPRKNTPNTVRGFARMHFIFKKQTVLEFLLSDLKLAIVGPQHWRSPEIENTLEQAREECDIVETGYVSDSELQTLVKNSAGVLMASYYEGFGIPLALARSNGIPTLTACNSSLVEVTEANSVYAEPGSVDSLAMGMFQLLSEPSKSLPQDDDWLNYTRDLIQIHITESKAKLKTTILKTK
jgi:glycosyltransferase involved in cell wall biosynthesis